ncbi:MAG: YlmH/Sll1252 family protein [Oscillospiraceae bacterium]|nr:YlmH/Sll1252 family protein [Oscillospiraceae bacterium]
MKDDITKRRFEDLVDKSYKYNKFTFTSFLTEAELSEFFEMRLPVSSADYKISGGREGADRVMIRFGNPEELGYEEEFPICCIKVEPLQKKFADNLTHRDFLGALMNLGINRSELGDILVDDKAAFILCTENMADFLCSEITRVRHTTVNAVRVSEIPENLGEKVSEEEVQVSSERIDGVISKIYRISRGNCVELFRTKKVFVNSKCTENNSYMLKEGDRVSVRGFGKFRFLTIGGFTRKGNKIVKFERFIS